jgi:AGCS family alanine or glycine:cation symporter
MAGKTADLLWGPWTLALIAVVAVTFTLRTGFFQFIGFGTIMRNTLGKMWDKGRGKGGMSPFQAATTALASTVGMGNVAGVATAIAVGGPGAIFWMWLFALLGMISKVVEVTLAVHYRNVNPDGTTLGGPMYYVEKGLGMTWLAKLISFGLFVNAILAAGLLQPHTVGRAFLSSYGIDPYVTCGLLAVVTGVTVIGGVKRIGKVCETMVPFMSIVYIIAAVVLFAVNAKAIPHVFGLIFSSAFAPSPAMGGFAGAAVAAAIQKGVSRGMLSNEAGLGTAPMAHATATTEHPFEQGMWGAFEVFFDTIVICTVTAFAILSTGAIESGTSGVELTLRAFGAVFPPALAQGLISFIILFFCLSTQIGFFIYYETATVYLFGQGSMSVMKWVYLLPGIVFAGVANVDRLWVFADVATGLCAIPNLIAIMLLGGVFMTLMRDWKSGERKYATAIVDEKRAYVSNRSRG